MKVPGLNQRSQILIDYCHAIHLGYGMDLAAGALVLLSKMNHFGSARALDSRLATAFQRFDLWCKTTGRTSSLREFSQRKFGMQAKGLLGSKHGRPNISR